jgi:hypothetical protein
MLACLTRSIDLSVFVVIRRHLHLALNIAIRQIYAVGGITRFHGIDGRGIGGRIIFVEIRGIR